MLKEGFRGGASAEHSLAATTPSPTSTGFEPPPIELLAPLFPQLELVELLGKGGMGAVYKAKQRGLDRLVAVKILPPEVGRDPAFAERFTREARAMARLSHPHIVAIHDFGQTNGQFYFVMEFVDGANLRQVIQNKQLTPAEALAVVPQICDALQYAHDEGIVHRDIKPENILVDTKGRVKIADFGLSKLLREDQPDVSLTGTHQVMGTLRYMAPEQLQGTKGVDHRADIYSLGVVFYELLTGQLPMGRFDPPSKKVQVDVRLDEVVLRALEQEPEKRYQQASEVKTGVQAVMFAPPAQPTAVATKETPVRPTRGLAKLAALCVGLGVLIPILLYVYTQDRMLMRFALVGGQALAMLLGLLSYRQPLGRYAMLAAVAVFGAHSAVELFVRNREMPTTASAGTIATIQGETGPDTSGLDQGLVRYRVTGPAEHKLVTWVEYYVKGEKRRLREFRQTFWRIPRPGEGIHELVELRLQDGHKLSPEGKGKLRWDWCGTGGWMPSPFVEMGSVSWYGPQDRRWRLAPGEDAILWAMKGGKGDWSSSLHWGSPATGIMAEAKDADAFLVLKARIEPVTEAERRRYREGGGLGFVDEAYVPVHAGNSVAAQPTSTTQNQVVPVAPPSQPRIAADYDAIAKGTWVPRFNVPAEVDGPAGTLKNGVITLRDFVMDRAVKPVFFRDGIVRAKIEGSGSVHLRCTGDSYQLALMADGLHIYKWQDDAPVRLASVPPEALPKGDGFRELALVAVGSHLIGYLDGKRTVEVIDGSVTNEGVVAIHAHTSWVKFKDVEVMSLDGVDVKDALGGLEVLDRFVGLWNLEHTARPSQKHPEHTITSGKIATRWVLGGRYLRSDYELAAGPGPIVLATYDPQRDEYPTWVFTPSGSVVYSPRKWNAADQTLGGNAVDEETGTAVRCDDVLNTARSIARTLLVTDKDGRKLHDISDRLLRAGDIDPTAEPGKAAAGPAADVPQLKVLTPLVGDFATGGEMTDAAGKRTPFPAGQEKNRWIMHGRLLEERGVTPDGAADTHLCFWTYDADDEKYRSLFLPILGPHISVTYDWDEGARALVGRATLQSGEMATHRVQLADPDRIQWTMTPEAAGGKGPRFDGRRTRIKD